MPDVRRGLRHADGRAAVLQRLRAAAGAVEPVHRRARDLRGAPPERPAAARLRGRPAAARLRQRVTTSRARAGSRSSATDGAGRAFNVGSGRSDRSARSPSSSPACSAREHRAGDHRAVPRRRHPPLLRRHRARARRLLGYEPEVDARDGHRRAGGLARRARSRRPRRRGATRELAARGLTRMSGRVDDTASASGSLITGGAGFIGTNLADRLLGDGRRVVVLDDLSRPGVEQNLRWLRETHGDRVDARDRRRPRPARAARARSRAPTPSSTSPRRSR